MKPRRIPVASPVLSGREKEYVVDCLDSTWISSTGKYVDQFQSQFAAYCGSEHAVACCNGTVAVHLALLAFGLQPGDEVIVPSLTFIATANAVTYCGATPIFVDSEPLTGNLDPAKLEELITPRTKGVIAVHLFGHPADMDAIRAITDRHNLFLIEDAAEAHGAMYRGRRSGSLGDIATFSFYGNKIITSGEGGMVMTKRKELADKMALLRGQGMDPHKRYWFPIIGYNYRMTNVAAAIGLAQFEKLEWHLERHREVAKWYERGLKDCPKVAWTDEQSWAKHAYWMFVIYLTGRDEAARDDLMRKLAEKGIETRPVFYPLHILPPYQKMHGSRKLPVSERMGATGIALPTWSGLTEEDVDYVCQNLRELLG
jgi:perosamine synthetase